MNSEAGRFFILVINPGSTSTKVALYRDRVELYAESIDHPRDALRGYPSVWDQKDYRLGFIRAFCRDHRVESLDAIAARGGLLRPLASGVYRVTKAMVSDLVRAAYGEHASNLGALMADQLATTYGCAAFIADPVTVDEMDPVARLSGFPGIDRRSLFHALNQKAVAKQAARQMGTSYEECNLIVAHLGGGISVGAHARGRVVDVNDALSGEGPFSPERSGGVPSLPLAALIHDRPESFSDLRRTLIGEGGLQAYCRTADLREVLARIKSGDPRAALVFQAMAYQISKEIAMHGATLKGHVDAIVLTGGMARNRTLREAISERVGFLAPVLAFPGEREMQALADTILSALRGESDVKEY